MAFPQVPKNELGCASLLTIYDTISDGWAVAATPIATKGEQFDITTIGM
jgi:hypothetical protein